MLSSDSVPTHRVSTFRDSSALYADIVLDNPRYGIFGRAIETHWLWRTDLSQDSLRLVPFDDPWLTEAIDSGRVKTPVERETIGPRSHGHDQVSYILTGEAEEIERVLRIAEADENAFPVGKALTFRLWRRLSGQ